jgi:phosphoglycolate phosphatase-like HAD superfamily hydrolase
MLHRHVRSMIAAAVMLAATPLSLQAADDPLPSWAAGPARDAIVAFVEAAVDPASSGFVATEDRVAVFDNDGTLWAEQPMYFQFLFALDRAKALAAADPAFAATPALKAAAAGDIKGVLAGGEAALVEVVGATHSGQTIAAFDAEVRDWLATTRHPATGLPYTAMTYEPMLDLLGYLRANGFATYIVSGGGVDFMRAFADEAYGIPPENVIGSMGDVRFELDGDGAELVKAPGIAFIDDKEGKPVAIARHIGRRPVFVAGNSDGDLAMAQWSAAGDGPRFVLFVHHTDSEREWAYDRDSHVGRLDKALDEASRRGWTVVDMATDWTTVFTGTP